MRQAVILGGPSASGKSQLALDLAEALGRQGIRAEILAVDSITVYRGFAIGSAKPSAEERARVPHHLLDLAEPEEEFTAKNFVEAAEPIVQRLLQEEKTPIIVGGTGFYLRALLRGMAGSEESREKAQAVKAALEARAAAEGWEALHRELLAKDPGSRSAIHGNDHYRILRALQAMELHDRPWSLLNQEARQSPPRFPHRYFRLELSREELTARIQERTKKMLELGLVEEVKGLLSAGVSPQAKPMQSVGYRECVEHLQGSLPVEKLASSIVQSTLRLAKAQATWFRGEELAEPLPAPHKENLLQRLSL